MFRRVLSWRKTAAGVWSEWIICAALLIAAAAISAALGWHWIITGLLALIAVIVCALIALMWSIRNDLGEYDRAALHRHNAEAMKQSAAAMTPDLDENGDPK
ncbi:hypothetical protein [Paracoccus sp. 22332]|uniref:hypothetical protein n=1 Tax=Paracoccus sp. 22332 TaxID=3453913 RepID=UPI003F8451C8